MALRRILLTLGLALVALTLSCSSSPLPPANRRAITTKHALRIPPLELLHLVSKAPQDPSAAMRVATYYVFSQADDDCAIHYYRLAAEQGHLPGYHALAHMLAWSDERRDLPEARRWITKGIALAKARGSKHWERRMIASLDELQRLESIEY